MPAKSKKSSSTKKAKKPVKKTVKKKAPTVKKVVKKPVKKSVKKAVKKVAKKPVKKVVKKPTAKSKAPAKKVVNKVVKKPTEKKAKAEIKVEKPVAKKAPSSKKIAKKNLDDAMKRSTVSVVSQVLGFQGIEPYQPMKSEAYMSERMQMHFRKILEAWRRQLMEEVDRTVHHMKDDAANFPDPNDRATQEEEFSLELRTRDRERKLIRKIEESLRMLDEGEYGFCEACGVEIGLRRLEARPTAVLCIDCKTLDEIKEKQIGG